MAGAVGKCPQITRDRCPEHAPKVLDPLTPEHCGLLRLAVRLAAARCGLLQLAAACCGLLRLVAACRGLLPFCCGQLRLVAACCGRLRLALAAAVAAVVASVACTALPPIPDRHRCVSRSGVKQSHQAGCSRAPFACGKMFDQFSRIGRRIRSGSTRPDGIRSGSTRPDVDAFDHNRSDVDQLRRFGLDLCRSRQHLFTSTNLSWVRPDLGVAPSIFWAVSAEFGPTSTNRMGAACV